MKRNRLSVTKNEEKSYTVKYELEMNDVVDTKILDMGMSGRLVHMAAGDMREERDVRTITYQIKDMVPLADFLKKEINKKQMLTLLYHVLAGLESFGMNMVSLSYVAKDTQYIFVHPDTIEVCFIVVPVDKQTTDLSEIKALVKDVIVDARYFEMDRDNYVAKVISFANRTGTFSIADMKEYIDKLLSDMGIHIEEEKKERENGAENKTAERASGRVNRLDVMKNHARMNQPPMGGPNGMPGQPPMGGPNGMMNRPPMGGPNGMPGQPPMGGPNGMPGQPPMGGPNGMMNRPPMGGPNGMLGQPPMGGPNGMPGQPPMGGPNGMMNRPPMGGPNGMMNRPPMGGPNGMPGQPPMGGPNGMMNRPPMGGPNGMMNRPPMGGPNGMPGQPPMGGPNGMMNRPPMGGPNGMPGQPLMGGPNGMPGQPPMGGPNGMPGRPPMGGPNGMPGQPPMGGPNGMMNQPPMGGPNGMMNRPPMGGPNGMMNRSPMGGPNGMPGQPPMGDGQKTVAADTDFLKSVSEPPRMPEMPVAPEPPRMPEMPVAPESPRMPEEVSAEKPEATETPEKPETAVPEEVPAEKLEAIETPKEPETAVPEEVLAEKPEAIETPKEPETVPPQMPEMPVAPEPPQTPEMPAAPEPPQMPEMPQMPEIPVPYLLRTKTNEKIYLDKDEFTIGKSATKADYTISDNTAVSRIHCIITKRNGVSYIRDNNSTNGTFINNEELISGNERFLTNHAHVILADEEFIFFVK